MGLVLSGDADAVESYAEVSLPGSSRPRADPSPAL